ncbi:TMEM175 family protein [Lacticaseibacillus camelliae]|uniref:TMEM175 family protein n=1 Tax=Lacticaseibacillus camelliae TaxID=381742 RepID=UPI00272E6F97|nr:TMEM175 family protein [Lacticaseibacillus camelliae]
MGGFWALRDQFIAYFISFFWIGAMWVGLHNNWRRVKTITRLRRGSVSCCCFLARWCLMRRGSSRPTS